MAKTGSHSIWGLSTLIIGDTPFPEFSVVVMLDDIQLFYYDSDVGKLIDRTLQSKHGHEEQQDAKHIFGEQHQNMKERVFFFRHLLNSTHEHIQWMLTNIYSPTRIKTLKNHLNAQQNYMRRRAKPTNEEAFLKDRLSLGCDCNRETYSQINEFIVKVFDVSSTAVKPRVRLLQKRLPDSGGVRVTCLATGFYPRHINLTLLRDGQPVPDHQITGGELLPNGDETYQMRKSLEVSTEELQQHHYTCTAQHLSLDNKLDFGLEDEPEGPLVAMVPSTLVSLVLGVTGVTTGFILLRKRNRCTQTSSISTSSYTVASSTVQEDTTTGNAL
ncbi:hereditary hemochromatosis protein homolog [Engraulis encrasicolus]|uniref:hereditary hemochromatosis protein homolog n=1 Tax=Engraulis encrasicolus TaxID=184585 RepID=UPI002FCFF8DE